MTKFTDKQILSEITSSISDELRPIGSTALFSDKKYSSVPLDQKHFKEIQAAGLAKKDNITRLAFVDGGNAEIIGASNFSLQIIRVYYTIYENNKRSSTGSTQFYCLVQSSNSKEKQNYVTKFFPSSNNQKDIAELKSLFAIDTLTFDAFDATLRTGTHKFEPSKIAEAIRRFSEINAAARITEESGKEETADVIILDGTLQSSMTYENAQFERLYSAAKSNNVIICSLAKTSTINTDSGVSLQSTLQKMVPDSLRQCAWQYYPIVNITHPNHKADLYFVKLHKKSDYIFRFEIFNEQNHSTDNTADNAADKVIALLAKNSSDPVFLGYPYGLIEADKMARVSNSEKEAIRIKLSAVAGAKWKNILSQARTVNAHSILDRIS